MLEGKLTGGVPAVAVGCRPVTPKLHGMGISSYIRKSTRARRGCCTRYIVTAGWEICLEIY